MNILPGGLYPVMITPFNNNGAIDYKGLEELVEFYIEKGSKGLFANCLSSEMYYLSDEERIELTKKVVEFAKGRVPVLSSGTFNHEIEKVSEFFKKIYSTGVNAVIINSNQLNKPTDDEITFKNSIESLLNQTDNIPVGIYECPVPYKRLISADLLGWMAGTERFLYFKDTSCDNNNIADKLKATKGSKLGLFNANIPTGLQSLKDGGAGLSPIGANYFPELYAFVCDNYKDESKSVEIRKVNTFLSVIDLLIHSCYPFASKFFLQKRGLKIGLKTRTDYVPFTAQDYIKFDDLMVAFEDIKPLIA